MPVGDVGMYACGLACCACCGVLQRRHNFDAFLKRLGSGHACKLTLNWLGTATRNSLQSMWTFTYPMTVSITAKFKAAKNAEKWTQTSEGLAGPWQGKTSQSAAQRIPLNMLPF